MMPDQPGDHCSRAQAAPARANEHAFSLIELIVVMIIIAVLTAIAIGTGRSARDASELKSATSAAQSYRQAVSAFMLDHGNRVPEPGGTVNGLPDWSTSLTAGPMDRYGRAYLKGIPEAIQGSLVTFASGTAQTDNGMNRFALVYTATPPSKYSIRVYYRKEPSAAWSLRCELGNEGAEKC